MTQISLSRRSLLAAAAVPATLDAAFPAAAATSTKSRLFFTPSYLAKARSLKAAGKLPAVWTTLRAACDAARKNGPGCFQRTLTADPTRWWQRYVGWAMANLGAAYLLAGDTGDRDMAIELAGMAADFPIWGVQNQLNGGDLNAADMLLGVATVIDWLSPGMATATRAKLITTLRTRGAQMANYATGIGEPVAYWAQLWIMNHLWNNMSSLLAAGLALQDDAPVDAAHFIKVAVDRLTTAFNMLPPDGAWQESPAYWDYNTECVLKFHHLATEILGLKLDTSFMAKAALYRATMTLPHDHCTSTFSMINQADGVVSPWQGPVFQLRRLASLNQDGAAQALADFLEAKGATKVDSPWLSYVWYDETVPAAPTTPPASFQFFDDLKIVVARTDWSGKEALVVMRSGPPVGENAQKKHYTHDVGIAHVHQDINHVTLFADGHFMLQDDGYSLQKLTSQHNTLLINGLGQSYEGGNWTYPRKYPLPDPQPGMNVVLTSPAVDYWVGIGASAYPTTTGLVMFSRHVLFVKPGILVVIDELAAAKESTFTLLWHPGAEIAATAVAQQFAADFTDSTLLSRFVLPDGGSIATQRRDFHVEFGPTPISVPEIAVTIRAVAAQAGAVFTWGKAGATPQVTLDRESATWVVTTATQRISLLPSQRHLAVS